MDNLENLKEEIIKFLSKENLNIFYSSVLGIPEEKIIIWDNKFGDWKKFLTIAKEENIKTIVIVIDTLEESDIESNDELGEEQVDIDKKLETFKKYIEKIGRIRLLWIKNEIIYSYSETTNWYDEFLSLIEEDSDGDEEENYKEEVCEKCGNKFEVNIDTEQKICNECREKSIKEKTIEELTDEFIKIWDKEYFGTKPNLGILYQVRNQFLEYLDINYFDLDEKLRNKIQRVIPLVKDKITKRDIEMEKQIIPKLAEECVKWTKENELKKITRSSIDLFLSEKNKTLSYNGKEILKQKSIMLLQN